MFQAGKRQLVGVRRGGKRLKRGGQWIVTLKRGRHAKQNGELKFHDLDIDDSVIAAGGNIAEDSVLTIAQGTSESQRIGRKLILKSIGWRFFITLISTSVPADTSDVVRVILYLDKQANGATAAVTDILETSDFQSFNNLANKSRFRTLMDRTFALSATAGSFDGTNDQFGEFKVSNTFFKNVNIPIEYDNSLTTGVITTMRSNNIGVLLLSQSGTSQFGSKMRLRFSDG